VSRSFFDQVDDEVRGFVGPELREFSTVKNGRLIKLWYRVPAVHFEAQRLSAAWSPSPKHCIEVGLHLEAKDPARNEWILGELLRCRQKWLDELAGAECGPCFGPRGSAWRRVSEVIELEEMDADSADEIAERFSTYIVTLQPLLEPLLAG
jgi:hypothetical protein